MGMTRAVKTALVTKRELLMKLYYKKLYLFLFIFCLCGCTPIFPKKVSEPLESNIKNNQNSAIGALSVYSENHIYYYSDENEISGIYRMSCDGSQVELVTECRDVKKLQIRKGVLYYLDFDKNVSNHEIITRTFILKKLNLKTGEKSTIELYGEEQKSYGTWDFCVGDSNIAFTSLTYNTPTQKLIEATGIKRADGYYLKSFSKLGKEMEASCSPLYYYLYSYDNWYLAEIGVDLMEDVVETPFLDSWSAIGIYEKEQREPGFLYHAEVQRGGHDTRILYQGMNRILVANLGRLSIYNSREMHQENVVEAENVTVFKNAVEKDGKILLLAVTKNGTDKILCLDMETYDLKEVCEVPQNARIVYLNTLFYVVLDENSLTQIFFDGTANKWDLTKNMIKQGYRTDMCGDWLFITHWDARKKKRKLDFKINMEDIQTTITSLDI